MRENLEFGRGHILKGASGRERKLVALAKEIDEPRLEYVEGKMKLKFEHAFSNGMVFSAQENNQGVAKIILEQNNSEILDFGQYLPESFRFVTPTYLKQRPLAFDAIGHHNYHRIGKWFACNPERYVAVGDMRDARAIPVLLHEIGHAQQLDMWKKFKDRASASMQPKRIADPKLESLEREIRIFSAQERNAWAWALVTGRKIRKRHGVDLFEATRNFEELQDIIYAGLLSHRFFKQYRFSQELLQSMGLKEKIWNLISGGRPKYQKMQFLKELFDKQKLV